ncbi:MAG: hypothetical protein G01um101448_520 [Parcubacteria group bacterium Gr01-1014_48]|nr:MAG: hypothetical protein Greene041614_184 [Parcubacteria group bacterium Greene0416_14]TSC73831.1 MAG: hypothetical protein G01um101448_520 [Parcubacteria group bacterium Gr01-1014_48]TSD01212.1 MAG: hypothetical protein Greene101415_407 [Parcubacteria group bacterium Greene1014_15]TSD07312.1 MAG: hypothetical protein Greene07144_945 [Parcubacteria group bacterium Greene0714_4]
MIKKRGTSRKKRVLLRRTLFWDVNPKDIDPKKHAKYVIERIMDFGNDKEVRWMWNQYSRATLNQVAKSSRGLRPRTRELWTTLTKK